MSKKAEFRDIAESRSRNGNGGGGQRREKCDIETDGNNVRGTLLVKVDYDARATFLLRFYSSPLKPLSPISSPFRRPTHIPRQAYLWVN